MPHAHDEKAGGFRPLAAGVVQIESALEAPIQSNEVNAGQVNEFLGRLALAGRRPALAPKRSIDTTSPASPT